MINALLSISQEIKGSIWSHFTIKSVSFPIRKSLFLRHSILGLYTAKQTWILFMVKRRGVQDLDKAIPSLNGKKFSEKKAYIPHFPKFQTSFFLPLQNFLKG